MRKGSKESHVGLCLHSSRIHPSTCRASTLIFIDRFSLTDAVYIMPKYFLILRKTQLRDLGRRRTEKPKKYGAKIPRQASLKSRLAHVGQEAWRCNISTPPCEMATSSLGRYLPHEYYTAKRSWQGIFLSDLASRDVV